MPLNLTYYDTNDVSFDFNYSDIFKFVMSQRCILKISDLCGRTIQLAVILSGALGLSIPFGLYIARMISFETRPLEKTVAKVEQSFFQVRGININKEMTWKEYFSALLLTTIISIIFVILKFNIAELSPFFTTHGGYVNRFSVPYRSIIHYKHRFATLCWGESIICHITNGCTHVLQCLSLLLLGL